MGVKGYIAHFKSNASTNSATEAIFICAFLGKASNIRWSRCLLQQGISAIFETFCDQLHNLHIN